MSQLTRPKSSWEKRAESAEAALDRIAHYDSPERLRRHSEKHYGLEYVEALEYAYENIRDEAQAALKGVRRKRRQNALLVDAVDPVVSNQAETSTREKASDD